MKLGTRLRHWLHSKRIDAQMALGLSKKGPTRKNLKQMEEVHKGMQPAKGKVEMTAKLFARKLPAAGMVVDYGLVSERLVTDAFINFFVDQLQSSTGEIGNFAYHGSGISTTAENASQTTLLSEVGSRAFGTQGEGATQNIYKAVGVVNYGATYAITEHGLFDAATSGILMDRSVFGAINVTDGDAIEFSYELTVTGS